MSLDEVNYKPGAKTDPEKNNNEKYRKCMTCAKPFLSSHIGNRICLYCKSRDVYRNASMD